MSETPNVSSIPVVHLVPAGRPIGTTLCGLPTETPDRPWRKGLVPDAQWTGPLGEITCRNCLEIEAGEPIKR